MKKRNKSRAERTRRKRARREEKRNAKGTMTMVEKKIATIEQIRKHVEKKEYAGVINAFADMIEQGNPPEECYGDVARAYFELGDYTRAADWVTNTLIRDPGNVDVRILLGRICQREKRTSDALKLYDSILHVYGDTLSAAQRTEISRLAGLDARLNPTQTRTEYPYLAALFGMGEAPAPQTAAASTPAAPAPAASAPRTAAPAASSGMNAEQQAEEILAREIRSAEKVAVLNSFAGAAYAADDYAGAKTFLMAALRLDPGCDDTLKNMALLLHDMGEHEKAIQVAAKMRMADFMLLRMLKS